MVVAALDNITKSKGVVLSLDYKRKRKPKGGKK